jgi:hypothetical protein
MADAWLRLLNGDGTDKGKEAQRLADRLIELFDRQLELVKKEGKRHDYEMMLTGEVIYVPDVVQPSYFHAIAMDK